MNETHKQTLENDIKLITEALQGLYQNSPKALSQLKAAQMHSLLAGGKRIRPVLTLAFCRLFGGNTEAAMPYALAVEMIHTASLIHDDLPSIDNDDLRRGRPTCHVAFGEATALLAADGLFMDAFGVVARNPFVSSEDAREAIRILSDATGSLGLVGGEFIDVDGEGKSLDLEMMQLMHSCKTGALIRAAVMLGALAAGVSVDSAEMKNAVTYADSIGLAFQIVDDVLDVIGTPESLGKNPGKDKSAEKSTYLNHYTIEEAIALADSLTKDAIGAISSYEGSAFLTELALELVSRRN